MKKIKVCHVVSGLKAGGVESMIYNYCSHMNLKNYEFHLLYQHEASKKNVDEFNKIGFKLHRIPSKIKHPLKNYYETKKYLYDNKIDIVHCHMTLMNFIPLIAAKKLNIKTRICHSHNSDVRKKNIFVKIIEYFLKKICVYYSTSLIACGEDAGKYMYKDKEFIILNNALNLNKFAYNDEFRGNIRNKYGIKEDEIVIGHVGRFTVQKNHKFVIELFKELTKFSNKYKLMLVGDGELRDEINNLVNDYNLEDKVIFTGIIDNTNEVYSAFDIFVLPSVWEGLPVVGIEAQASGLYCLFSLNIDKNVVINDEKTKMLDLDIDIWVKDILKICNFERSINKKIYSKLGYEIDSASNLLDKIYRIEGK